MGVCRLLAAILGLVVATGSAGADELTDFHAAIEQAASHNRVAIAYLRTENVDLAAFELDGLRQAWSAFATRFGKSPPAGLRDNPLFATTLVDVPVRVVAASMMINMGRPDLARDSLLAIRDELSALRRTSHIEVLADCVLDANRAMDALIVYHDNPPDWAKPDVDREGSGESGCLCWRPAALRQHGTSARACKPRIPSPGRRRFGVARARPQGDRSARQRSAASLID